ncbi:MAG: hypothetical protein JF614_29975 [Acidobacteria bacterium]|jgi:hypothetical protein|nr:hypothetical protein [Acidobacteriota bacterium]
MRKTTKKLVLCRETLRNMSLAESAMQGVAAGATTTRLCVSAQCSGQCTVQNCPSRPPVCSARIACLPGTQ